MVTKVRNALIDGETDGEVVIHTDTDTEMDVKPEALTVPESFVDAVLVAGGLSEAVVDIATVNESRGV